MVAFLMEVPRHKARGPAAVSLLVHAALISGAVLATIQTRVAPTDLHRAVPIVYVEAPTRPAAPPLTGPGTFTAAPAALQLLIPVTIPTVIPPPASRPFDPSRFGAAPVPALVAGPVAPDTGAHAGIYVDRRVDERPELLSHPPVAYPEVLRQAGIDGRAVVEAVIDTAGRAERGSIRVLSSTHPLFAPAAAAVVAASIYRPGRLNGRAVRVRVQVPIDFRVAGRGTSLRAS